MLLSFLKPHRYRFLVAMLALFVSSILNLALPELARRALSSEQLPHVGEHLSLWMFLVAALFLLQGLTSFIRSYLFNLIGHRVFAGVRQELFRAILGREISFFDSQRAGQLAARLNSDAALVQEAVSVKASVLIRYTLQVVCGTILMVWMSWRLTAAIVGSLVVVVTVSTFYASKLRTVAREYQHHLARLVSFATDIFGSVRMVQALAAQQEVLHRFGQQNMDALRAGERRGQVGAAFASGASLLLNLLLVLVAWYGISLVLKEELPLNDLAAFVLYGGIVAASSAFLVGAYADIAQSLGGLERVFELLREASPPYVSGISGEHLTTKGPTVECRAVTFRYEGGGESEALHDVSLTLAAGKVTALVGPSGSGKSSLVQLLLRFYKPQHGEIYLDGISLSTFSEAELRSTVAWVPHDPELFALSVFDNLALGNQKVAPEQVETVISSWPFMEFIKELPHGLHTVIGENGVQLSAGQRQRIAIARALLRSPKVLILDEATSGLDSDSEQAVFSVLRTWLPYSTVFIISHRLATVRDATSAYVIQNGHIIQRGTHEELRQVEGLYQQFAQRQSL
jgi:ABC-type multidrug transport system fused ATPase/permease subunit